MSKPSKADRIIYNKTIVKLKEKAIVENVQLKNQLLKEI